MTLREPDGEWGARGRDHGAGVLEQERLGGDALLLRAGLHGRRPRLRPRRRRARRGRAGVRAAAGPRRARGRGRGRARRDGPGRRALLRRPDGDAARGRHHRHERQDDDRLPGPRRARGGRAADRACSARSSRWSAAWRRRSSAPRRRRSTCRRRSRACSTPATGACAMEVSSHALELGRADGITFACTVFTNLTQDHLDFHDDMEAYFVAKRRLFDRAGPGGRERRRRLRPPPGGRAGRTRSTVRRSSARPTTALATCRFDAAGAAFTVDTPDGAGRA